MATVVLILLFSMYNTHATCKLLKKSQYILVLSIVPYLNKPVLKINYTVGLYLSIKVVYTILQWAAIMITLCLLPVSDISACQCQELVHSTLSIPRSLTYCDRN